MNAQGQIEELKEAMKYAKDHRLYERFQAVYLFLIGYTRIEIAKIINRRRQTVGTYINAYKEKGLKGLELGHSPGRPSKLSKEQKATLFEVITTKVPADVGFTARYNWTLALACAYVKREWNQDYSIRSMSDVLHGLGLSYTRPTYTLEKADPEKQKEFVEKTFADVKKSF
ncbi:putative transposase [Cytobacillus purgationiresistens]|uniref:Transposase n=1 Tax=Cytobacillus purgationiresistens TaxID=863449 RepID=A0ABU0AT21_9BACI|nr:putative transposase [Cytobacillus purgationiresistens]